MYSVNRSTPETLSEQIYGKEAEKQDTGRSAARSKNTVRKRTGRGPRTLGQPDGRALGCYEICRQQAAQRG